MSECHHTFKPSLISPVINISLDITHFSKINMIVSVRNSSKTQLVFSVNMSKDPFIPEKTVTFYIAWLYKISVLHNIYESAQIKVGYFLNLEAISFKTLLGLCVCLHTS